MKRILLHICCAPCAIFPIELLRHDGFKVKAFFFNPNIHPFSEYQRRLAASETFAKEAELELETGLYQPKVFFQAVNKKEDLSSRCHICWGIRLSQTAQKAKLQNCEYFSTTLLGSPYQDTAILERIGQEEAKNSGLKFLSRDFKSGFREAHKEAKQRGLYCQKYCGCIYSEIERFKERL